MKRIFSLLITAAMMLSTASVAFAADCNYKLEPAADTVAVGEVVEFTLKLDSNPGIAGFVNIMEFDSSVFERVSYIKLNEDDEEEEYDAYSSWGSLTVNDGIKDQTIFQIALPSNKTGKTVLKVNYKVKSDATNGDYTFKMLAEEAMNADGASVDVGAATATITVTGGKEPAGSSTPATYAIEYTPVNEEVAYTKGIKGTITPNDDAVTGVNFTLKNTANDKTKFVDWTFDAEKIAGKSPIVFGLNVLNVPAGVDVTIDGDVTILK